MAKKSQYPSDKQDQFMIRLPAGMRDRIKKAAERSGRSMNSEIVTALEAYYPPEPTLEDVLESVHSAISKAHAASNIPYRQVLVDALDELSDRLASGLEPDQYVQRLPLKGMEDWEKVSDRMVRWRRVQKYGVATDDLERELDRGLLKKFGGDTIYAAIRAMEEGKPERALKWFRLGEVKFAEPEAAYAAIERWLKEYYRENWGDPDAPPPWDDGE
ncbi:Arc family DNA-binding protein [Chelativorans sp. ZYF759]|uniref:Arc family DNA-binding protein n=1 Tax=Chelativorans sp. ZYF759 TaxID=2692213 RepID=UPI00145E73A2|nr:Arc family DNA-binding protein [Chelativorans sp. ZYF759]NMG39912.1 Arc family DNA-binding protein [Chelativorans sp. ZYF759]